MHRIYSTYDIRHNLGISIEVLREWLAAKPIFDHSFFKKSKFLNLPLILPSIVLCLIDSNLKIRYAVQDSSLRKMEKMFSKFYIRNTAKSYVFGTQGYFHLVIHTNFFPFVPEF